MNGLDSLRTVGSAVRPGIVLAVCVIGGTVIGKNNDNPVMGLAIGIATGALVNGLLNWREERAAVA